MNKDLFFRDLSTNEVKILKKMLSVDFEGRENILEQINEITTKVKKIDKEGSLIFKTKCTSKANVKGRIPVEAVFVDTDGIKGYILLHIVNGIINELEFYKEDNSRIIDKVNPLKIEVLTL